MDPITQTLTGAVAAQAVLTRPLGRVATLAGAVGGALPDIDVLFDRWADPALPFELHRHFTHALAFIPVGGLVAALPFLLVRPLRKRAGLVIAATMIGYATHGLLDNTTSYGTHLLWPFRAGRTAWDVMSIIDPIFTTILLLGLLATLVRGHAVPARCAFTLAVLYIGFGFVQHHRVEAVQRTLASARGHVVERGRVMPTLGNIIVWRSIYEHEGRLFADAVRVPPFGALRVRSGTSAERFTSADLPDAGSAGSRIREVFAGFEAFADGYVAKVASNPTRHVDLGDMRYSLRTGDFDPLWGLRIEPQAPGDPVRAIGFTRDREGALQNLWRDLIAPGPEWEPLPSRSPRAAQ